MYGIKLGLPGRAPPLPLSDPPVHPTLYLMLDCHIDVPSILKGLGTYGPR